MKNFQHIFFVLATILATLTVCQYLSVDNMDKGQISFHLTLENEVEEKKNKIETRLADRLDIKIEIELSNHYDNLFIIYQAPCLSIPPVPPEQKV